MKSLTPKQLSGQLKTVAQGAEQALAWVNVVRASAPRLEMEADRLSIALRRCRNKANDLAESALKETAMGFFGLSQAGKSYLIAALAAGENQKVEVEIGGLTLDYQQHLNPYHQQAAFVTRFTRQPEGSDLSGNNGANPVQLLLLSEADLACIIASAHPTADEPDDAYLIEHLNLCARHRQSEPTPGLTHDDVVALWDALARRDAKRQQVLENRFWPQAVELAPYLGIDDRATLFAPLWGEHPELTALYRQFAYTLAQLSASNDKVLAPISVLVDDTLQPDLGLLNARLLDRLNTPADLSVQVWPAIGGRAANAVELSLAELMMLTAELQLPLLTPPQETRFEQVDLLDFPGFSLESDDVLRDENEAEQLLRGKPHPLAQALLRAKRAWLLERYTDQQQMSLLMVCSAAAGKADVRPAGKALDYWVRHTQGENAQVRSQRKPGLIWAVTRFDRRFSHGQNHDEAVQRFVGNPGDTWGTMLALDARGVGRMAAWLDAEVRRDVKLGRIGEQLNELQRELTDNLLGSWRQPASVDDPLRKQRIAQTLLKALQTRTGVHGELLERLLPARDELRRRYLQQPTPASARLTPQEPIADIAPLAGYEPFGVGLDIDLFSDEDAPAAIAPMTEADAADNHGYEAEFARGLYRYWINHLRRLPDSGAMLELLGIARPVLEMLLEELITASVRLRIEDQLLAALDDGEPQRAHRNSKADRQVSRALTVLGDFVAWLGFQQVAETERPDSRVNKGHKIFAKPEKQAVNFGASQRLTKLSAAPTNNTAYYIYDWLIGLNDTIARNAGYAAGRDLKPEQRQQLEQILAAIAA